MAEARRLPLESSKNLSKLKKEKVVQPTYRFNLKLLKTNEQNCPEFSYTDLKREARLGKKKEIDKEKDPLADDNSQEVRQLAKALEERYGPKSGYFKKRKSYEDFVDKGLGYDDTDPFIDNDEAYDELVPSTLTTQHGGFYINHGGLNYKEMSDSDFESPIEARIKKKRRKHTDLDRDYIKRRKKMAESIANSQPKKRGRKPNISALNGAKPKSTTPTVADLIQQQKLLKQQQALSPAKEPEKCATIESEEKKASSSPVSSSPNILSSPNNSPQPSSLEPMNEKNVNLIIESVVKAAVKAEEDEDDDYFSVGSRALVIDEDQKPSEPPPKLPDNLPPKLMDIISILKEAALKTSEGKCKFFNEDINQLLLQVEVQTKELSQNNRSIIYSFLASYLPCTKETLLKRAKKLRLNQDGDKLKTYLDNLKYEINKVMPHLEEKYSVACKMAGEAKDADTKLEGLNELQNTPNGSDDESPEGEDKKASRMPRKKFEWNNEIKTALCKVVDIKYKSYEVSKARFQTPEEFIRQFLDLEIKILWPPGWIQTRMLLKETRSVHGFVNKRKNLGLTKKTSLIGPIPLIKTEKDLIPLKIEKDVLSLLDQIEVIPLSPHEPKETIEPKPIIPLSSQTSVLKNWPTKTQQDDILSLIHHQSDLSVSKISVVTANPSPVVTKVPFETFLPKSTTTELITPKLTNHRLELPSSISISSSSPDSASNKRLTMYNYRDSPLQALRGENVNSLLEKIISDGLANYPNSSTKDPLIGKQETLISLPKTVVKTDKAYSSMLKANATAPTPEALVKQKTPGASLLKINSGSSHSSNPLFSPPQSKKNMVEVEKLLHHPYGFNEAIKKSLAMPNQTTSPSRLDLFSNSKDIKVTSSNRDPNSSEYADEFSKFKKAQKLQQQQQVSKQEHFYKKSQGPPKLEPVGLSSAFPEGMKGFPLPIKSNPDTTFNSSHIHKSPSPSKAISTASPNFPFTEYSRQSNSQWRSGVQSPVYSSSTSSSLYQSGTNSYLPSSTSNIHPHIVTLPANRTQEYPQKGSYSHPTTWPSYTAATPAMNFTSPQASPHINTNSNNFHTSSFTNSQPNSGTTQQQQQHHG